MATPNNELKAALTQVFRVSVPEGVSGMYATSLDLFFRKKSNSFGLELCLVELTDGQPDMSKVVANSITTVDPADVVVSETSESATNFKFPQPVFLSAGARYAFVVRALAGSPDYEIWTGVNGGTDIDSGKAISSNPLSEQAYFAKTTSDWAEIPNEDIKYKLYRAKFNIDQTSKAVLKKAPHEILQLKNIQYATGGPELRSGDEVFGIASDSGLADANVYAKVITFDPVNNLLYLVDSTGQFAANANIMIVRSSHEGSSKPDIATTGVIAYTQIYSVFDFPVHAIVPKIGDVSNSLGSVSFEYRGTYKEGSPSLSVKETADSDWKPVINQEELDMWDKPRYALSHSTEVAELSGNTSVEIRGNMSSNNNFISPVIDLRQKSIIAIRNLINSNTANEDGDYGQSKTRYISKTITLADGQEAEDLKVYITAYKPPRTIINVYAKFWNAEDSDTFDSKKWTLLTQVTESTIFSDPKNPEDYREFEFDTPHVAPVDGAAYSPLIDDPIDGDPIQYSGPNGIYIGYKKYAIKVVMAVATDEDAYNYPRLSDVRAIALQK